jgi:hypothetical protein
MIQSWLSVTLSPVSEWLLDSGIQDAGGGVARYYRADVGRNLPVSVEITGYATSALLYLHELTGQEIYRERAMACARFLMRKAWNARWAALPFELDPPTYTYFFDCGIVGRGLLAAWRATGDEECLATAMAIGRAMRADFRASDGTLHPILALPAKQPIARDTRRWSQAEGCYQLKAAMAWLELAEVSGEERFREPYEHTLDYALGTWQHFVPGPVAGDRVMDRLHAFLYFLEGLLPAAGNPRCAAALADGIGRTARYLNNPASDFVRSDVYAQLLRIRVYADGCGAVRLDRQAAEAEARQLVKFEAPGGGYYFGRKGGQWIPHLNPVSAVFALQALEVWRAAAGGEAPADWHALI